MGNRILIALFFIVALGYNKAQGTYDDEATAPSLDGSQPSIVDSLLQTKYQTDSPLYPKEFQPEFKTKYQSNVFDYATITPRESLWEKLKREMNRFLSKFFGEVDPQKTFDYGDSILKIIMVIIIIIVLFFIVKYLSGKNGSFFFSKKNKKIKIDERDLVENIHQIRFPEMISEYERKRDFRWAIRYQFLFVLKKLTDKKRIDWNPEKTNRDYINEMKTAEMNHAFSDLVYVYDYVWYGEFKINEEAYDHFKERFNLFTKQYI